VTKNKRTDGLPSRDQVRQFDLAAPMLDSLYREMKELSKKSPDGILNALKVRMINRVLTDLRTALGSEPSTAYLDLLEDEKLPSNSDVVLVLSQYDAAATSFRSRYTKGDDDDLFAGRTWTTSEDR
jgi:hypothetical protein